MITKKLKAIEFKNVTKEYIVGQNIIKSLDNINFSIDVGKITVILGPSGSGKSTTLNLIGGMDRLTKGEITVFGQNISEYTDNQLTNYRRDNVGFVFQFYNLIPSLTAYENVDISTSLVKNPLDPKDMIKAVGLESRMNHFPAEMSGGELQRISIARALCKNANILLCDEPTGALDSSTGKVVLEVLQKMAREYKKTVIIVTHNAKIADCADFVLKIKDGKVVEEIENETPLEVSSVEW